MSEEQQRNRIKRVPVKGQNVRVTNVEFGELLETKITPEELEEGKKPNLYIKITASDEDLAKLRNGFTINLEDPKQKFKRQLEKFANDETISQNITERMNKLPKWVKKRLVMRVPLD